MVLSSSLSKEQVQREHAVVVMPPMHKCTNVLPQRAMRNKVDRWRYDNISERCWVEYDPQGSSCPRGWWWWKEWIYNCVCVGIELQIFFMKSYILRLYVVSFSTRQKHLFQLGVLCSRLSDQLMSLWHNGSVALPERPWNKRREVPLLA